jgi:restriction endonuclease Mrr
MFLVSINDMFPGYEDIELPLLLELVRRGGSSRPSDRDSEDRTVYDSLADVFNLTQEEPEEQFMDDGKSRYRWENMVRWAKRKLKDGGLVDSPRHGVWEVTSQGQGFAKGKGNRK